MKRKVEFLLSAASPTQFPQEPLPEVAFLGRSNVGKSSLINALVGQPGIAKTSATPGCTRLINFFRVEDTFRLVDLPGYGYAKGPIADKEAWGPLIEEYLRSREFLRLSVVLLDSRRGWMDKDVELKSWLEFYNRPFVVAATKVDKLNQKEEHHGLAAIRRTLGLAPSPGFSKTKPTEPATPIDPSRMPLVTAPPTSGIPTPDEPALIPCSARTGRGVRELWQTIWKRTNP
jgi:GTP-binding protein